MGQGYEDHLVTQEADIPEIASLKEEFLTVMPFTTDVRDQRTQIDKFFMVLMLIGLHPDLETVRDQILGSSSIPSLDDVFARLLRISSTQTLPSDNTSDSSMLVSQTNSRGGRSVTWAASPHCPRWPSHLILSRISLRVPPHLRVFPLTNSEYDDYLRYQATKSASVASVAQTGNASACLIHTSSLGPWILDSGASDHIFGNKDLFSSITTTSALPTVTLANGSQTVTKGIGLTHPLPSLPLTSFLYTPECSFNLISISKITRTLNCSITFSDKFVTLQNRSTGKTIGIGRESQGLYHLTSPSTPAVCICTELPSSSTVAWATLVYPSSRKWSLVFHLCHRLHVSPVSLGNILVSRSQKRLNNRAKSSFELVHTDVWGPCRTASTLGF
ncbi:hypothetical protein CK203_086062 [Vitis vinifera]|uniref:Retrovirus-related Pol polyprotein from transposon TNT 1-94-like beta-barrel domain-containing protein n=1 Tax=Vitis vinifera TaxID=29760 RepID=A0A438D566_VITVI|nr:hypothetical protein CK203_086062 [Vitis vinifera]